MSKNDQLHDTLEQAQSTQEQRMGEGADAGIAVHKDLRKYPRSVEDIEAEGAVEDVEVPAISPELFATALTHEGHAAGPRSVDEDEPEAAADDD